MPGYYVLELHYKRKRDGGLYKQKEPEFVIVDDSSMAEFSKLKEDLCKCAPEPFKVQYYDDEDDVISIDTEEEFKEFTKVAKRRSAKGMLIKLILTSNRPINLDSFWQLPSHGNINSFEKATSQHHYPPVKTRMYLKSGEVLTEEKKFEDFNSEDQAWIVKGWKKGMRNFAYRGCRSKKFRSHRDYRDLDRRELYRRREDADAVLSGDSFEEMDLVEKMVAEEQKNAASGSNPQQELDETDKICLEGAASNAPQDRRAQLYDYCMKQLTKHSLMKQEEFDKLEEKIKDSLRKELMEEMKGHLAYQNKQSAASKEEMEYDEDSDGNLVYMPEKKKVKQSHYLKKLEKKEKAAESKYDQRLEKLELKKKKLLEKASLRTVVRKPVDPNVSLPFIMSAIATKESSSVTKKVTVGKVFLHFWHVINDGTVAWNNVELRHTWSTPGLEPDEPFVKCAPLIPGQESQVAMKFKAPKTLTAFISYWHFFYQFDSQWQQFGHYIAVTGNTKLPKPQTAHTLVRFQAVPKKEKEETKAEGENEKSLEAPKEEKIMNKETKSLYKMQLEAGKKHLEASLASAEIAAEMAREAANAAFRRAIGLSPSTSATASPEMAQLNRCLDEVVESVQSLNLGKAEEMNEIPDLEDNSSDKEASMDVNEESDPGFVVVNIPTPEQANTTVKNIKVKVSVDSALVHEKDSNIIVVEKNDKNTADTELTVIAEKKGDELNVNENMENNFTSVEKNEMSEAAKLPELLAPQSVSKCKYNVGQIIPPLPAEYAYNKLAEQQEPNITLPRPDPAVNFVYSHPPQRGVPMTAVLTTPVSHQHNPHPAFPVFPPQNSSSHAIVFPPPPLIHFSNPKMNPPMHYPHQIPTYPPMQSTPHVMPLLSSGIPSATALPPQPTMQMPPPQMNPQPVVGHHFPMNRMMPMHVQGYEPANHDCVVTTPIDTSNDFKPNSAFNNCSAKPITVTNNPGTEHNVSFVPLSKTITVSNNPGTEHNASFVPLSKKITVSNNPGTEHNASFFPLSVAISESKDIPDSPSLTTSTTVADAPAETAAGLAAKNQKTESVVQILPQALVDGAINVASSAYSTAWNALINLRSKEGESSEFDPVFENNMAILIEMGFINTERNARLLKQYHNDVNRVIGVICANGGTDNLNID